jgi:hypothetical protein
VKPNKKLPFTDLSNPQFFYEVVQYWVAFELVQVFHKYGLKPMFKENLEKWSNELHCIVQLLKKYHKQKKMTNILRTALTSFLNQQKQNTMDHSNVLNMAQERTSKISTLPFHWSF